MSTRFTALTVREGDAFLLENDGWKCLFDSGKDKSIIDLLQFKGVETLDLAICSHNDADHANGFIALLESGFPIREIWLPGLWASVLQFAIKNCNNGGEVVLDEECYRGDLNSLFSEESMSEDSFDDYLTFLGKREGSQNLLLHSSERLHDKLASHIIENPEIIESFLDCNLRNHFNLDSDEICSKELEDAYLKDSFGGYYPSRFYRSDHNWFGFTSERGLHAFFHHRLEHPGWTQHMVRRSLDFKLERILEIASLAIKSDCTIRWFEPSLSCTNEVVDHGFVPLNSEKMCSIKMPKSSMAYMYLLQLTEENKNSLVFEYTKNDVPLVRFSADSNCNCQSIPYEKSIIVTAPHHGSAANANVYYAIKGNDIIWVRSDKITNKRPCQEFKRTTHKYCLACEKYNYVSEVCFEYNTWLERWDYVRGERCRC